MIYLIMLNVCKSGLILIIRRRYLYKFLRRMIKMSDIVKLIIEIPKEDYKRITKYQNVSGCGNMLTNSIIKAIPLDDVKAEIKKMPTDYCGGYIGLDKNEVLEILDNIGKAESEVK
jgi:hypothetical protein